MKTILVADDVDINYLLLEIYLKNDFNVMRAHDGVEAVDIFKKQKPDLILMDCKMPNMDGLEAAKIIHGLSPETPVIMQSAYAFAEDKERAAEAGCIDFLVKPVTKQILLDMICKYLD
jgi:Response regulator containing CheY-like receiver, AAA-type ATPase, and DNA-binding domains